MKNILLLLALSLLSPYAVAQTGNVDLATVPGRDTVQLTIYNAEDLTLVRETRTLSFNPGDNRLQFSWANTKIDPTSVRLRFPDQETGQETGLNLIDTSFPHERPQTLFWAVESDQARKARVEISYFTSGIHWSADYTAVADASMENMDLTGFVRISNHSGERYEDAQVRLVVGKINLVERIEKLAMQRQQELQRMAATKRRKAEQRMRKEAARMAFDAAPSAMMEAVGMTTPKDIAKEGISDYFIYTIEGRETLPDGWSKRLRSFRGEKAAMQQQYRYWPERHGYQLKRILTLKNDKDSGLGTTPLPDGTVRIFQSQGDESLRYLAKQEIRYVAIGDEIELPIGSNPDVELQQVSLKHWRDEIELYYPKPRVYKPLDGAGKARIDHRAKVSAWKQHTLYAERIWNSTDRPISVSIRRTFHGDASIQSKLKQKQHELHTVQFDAVIPAMEKKDLEYRVTNKEGRYKKQNRLVLKNKNPQQQ